MRKSKLITLWVFAIAIFASPLAYAQYSDSSNRAQRSQSTTAQVGQYIDDAAITAKVKAALISDSQIKATNISVETNQGAVKLTGMVDTNNQKSEAEKDANRIDGVKSIDDLLTVRGVQEQ
jgi:hyperosmotically inducible protein